MKYEIKPITPEVFNDAKQMNLTEMDIKEFKTLSPNGDISLACTDSMENSRYCEAVYLNEKLVAVYGLGYNDRYKTTTPWCLRANEAVLTTDWLKYSKRVVLPRMIWEAEGKPMWNMVHKDNQESITWLKWLGFTFLETDYDMIMFQYKEK